MTAGTPVDREWVVVLKDGAIVIDWGDSLFQDVRSGDFIEVVEKDISHHVSNEDLEWLTKIGRVSSFSRKKVLFHSLPERPTRTLD